MDLIQKMMGRIRSVFMEGGNNEGRKKAQMKELKRRKNPLHSVVRHVDDER